MTSTLRKTAIHLLAATAVAVFGFLAFGVDTTQAYFADTEVSDGMWSAGTLAFDAIPPAHSSGISASFSPTFGFSVNNVGSGDPQYRLTAMASSCAPSFFSYLNISITGPVMYSGPLSSLDIASSSFEGGWTMQISTSPGFTALLNQTCSITLKMEAWQEGFAYGSGGFTDSETISITLTNTITAAGVVLNEVLPNPEGLDTQTGLQGEWIEFYNNGSVPVDLTGWYIRDSSGTKVTISATTTMNGQTIVGVPGSGSEWLVLFMNGSILNNDSAETISFYDPSSVLQDQYTYAANTNNNDIDSDSNNTPGGANTGSGGIEIEKQEGKSDARLPDGIGAWVDPVPTPGAANAEEAVDAVMTTDSSAAEAAESDSALAPEDPEGSAEDPELPAATSTDSATTDPAEAEGNGQESVENDESPLESEAAEAAEPESDPVDADTAEEAPETEEATEIEPSAEPESEENAEEAADAPAEEAAGAGADVGAADTGTLNEG